MTMNSPLIPAPLITYALYENSILVGFTNYLDFAIYFEAIRLNRSYTITEYFEFH
jgi:hypothetical protein